MYGFIVPVNSIKHKDGGKSYEKIQKINMENLKSLIDNCCRSGLYSTAIFYSEILHSVDQSDSNLLTLAECYYHNNQYQKAKSLLQKHSNCINPQIHLLTAKCLVELYTRNP